MLYILQLLIVSDLKKRKNGIKIARATLILILEIIVVLGMKRIPLFVIML